ncbi:MAG TPA: PHB depolymerase family esterase, partial [Gammaproteobacteria bacterium]|nr:PHB depolymerase family esterase [Gammaproteobacteria bacterium]
MKIHQSLAALAARLRSRFLPQGLRTLAAIRFRGGIQALFAAWRERRRKPLPDDETHTFLARAYAGSRTRRYLVHVPRGKLNSRPRPLVLVLHGCRQDNRDIEQITGFNQLADRHGFLVAYPFVTSYRGL